MMSAAVEFDGQHLVLIGQVESEALPSGDDQELTASMPQAGDVEDVQVAPHLELALAAAGQRVDQAEKLLAVGDSRPAIEHGSEVLGTDLPLSRRGEHGRPAVGTGEDLPALNERIRAVHRHHSAESDKARQALDAVQ